MEVIHKGKPYYYYLFTCPKCHSDVKVGESELHFYEDCYDIEMAETDEVCPNCLDNYIQVPKHNLEKYRIIEEECVIEIKKDNFWNKIKKLFYGW